MLWTIYSCPLPVVGRIHGDCYAGGVGLAAVCDVLVAADGVHFCLQRSPARPAAGDHQRRTWCARSASRRRGATSPPPSASARRQAQALGFVHEVVAAEALDAKVDDIVAALVANGPAAVKACKRLVQDVAGRTVDAALRADTARRIADIRASAEGREGVQSFLAKRAPGWQSSGS